MEFAPINPYHHYSAAHGGMRTRDEAVEERVIDEILGARIADEDRDSSTRFELKHSSAVTQFSRLLARQRSLPVDVCAAGGAMHDIYVIVSGSYEDHARRGVPIAREIMASVGGFTSEELDAASRIVGDHSDKHVFTDDPYSEFGKDVDVLDCFLYPGAFDWYLVNKPFDIFRHYLSRANAVWSDMNVPAHPGFSLLDGWSPTWFDSAIEVDDRGASAVAPAASKNVPPFLLQKDGRGWCAHYSAEAWSRAAEIAGQSPADLLSAIASDLTAGIDDPGCIAAMAWPAIAKAEFLLLDEPGERRLGMIKSSSMADA